MSNWTPRIFRESDAEENDEGRSEASTDRLDHDALNLQLREKQYSEVIALILAGSNENDRSAAE